jgi:virginiamycin B lyase
MGRETLNYRQYPAPIQIATTGPGSVHGFHGTASNIGGGFNNIDVILGATASSLVIDDRADTSPATWTITSTTVTRQVQGQSPTTWTYGGIANLEIDTGSGGSIVNVLSTSTATTIHDGGTDTVVVGNTTNGVADIHGAVSISNSPGVSAYTALTVDDSAYNRGAWHATLTETSPTIFSLTTDLRTGDNGNPVPVAHITFRQSDLRSLRILLGNSPGVVRNSSGENIDVGANYVTVANTPTSNFSGGLMTTITTGTPTAGSGTDQVYVRATTGQLTVNLTGGYGQQGVSVGEAGHTVDAIRGAVTVNSPSGSGTNLAIYDDGAITGQHYIITNHTVTTRSGLPVITYNLNNELVLYAGHGVNTIDVQGTSLVTVVNAGWSGNDTINVGDAGNTLNGISPIWLSLQINNPGSQVFLNDQGNQGSFRYTFTIYAGVLPSLFRYDTQGRQLNVMAFTGPLQNLTVNGSSGTDTFTVEALLPNVSQVTINGGSGTNTLAGPDARFREFGVPTAVSGPAIIRPGPDGNLWFAEENADKIGRINPTTGAVAEFSVPAGAQLSGVAAGPDGRVWFTEWGSNKIGRISTDGRTLDEFTVPTPASQPSDVVTGPDGAVWFTEYAGGKIGRVDPATGAITEFPIPSGAGAAFIIVGPDGNLWFDERSGNRIGRITTAGQVQEFTIPIDPSLQLRGITAGPDGNLWVTTTFSAHILKISTAGQLLNDYALPNPGSLPYAMAAGLDGFLYFTEANGGKIGRISTSGLITEYSPPTPNSYPDWLTTLPDGSVWFTEFATNKIGRLLPSAANQWQITGANAGTLDGVIEFSSVQNLLGGPGANVFAFHNGGSLAGTLDGGGAGPDTLDMRQVPTVQVRSTGPGTLHGFRGTASNIARGFDNIDVILTADVSRPADSSPSSSVVSSVLGPAGVNSGVVNGLGSLLDTPGTRPDGSAAAVALDLTTSLKQPATASTVPETFWDLTSGEFALDGIGVPFLAATQATSDGDDNTLRGQPDRSTPLDLYFANLGASDVTDATADDRLVGIV